MNAIQMAAFLQISVSTLNDYRRIYNLKKESVTSENTFETWLISNYSTTYLTDVEIMAKFPKTKLAIGYYVKKYQLKKGTNNNRLKTWLKQNYLNKDLNVSKIANKFNVSEELIESRLKTLDLKLFDSELYNLKFCNLKRINESPLKLINLPKFILSTSHYKKHYFDLYCFFKNDYCGEKTSEEIAYIYNIDLDFLKQMMIHLNVYGYEKYNLSFEQIKWLKNEFITFYKPFSEIFNLSFFDIKDKKEIKRFIKNK
jgi:hypothetical protein